jgi:TPR repeat protein
MSAHTAGGGATSHDAAYYSRGSQGGGHYARPDSQQQQYYASQGYPSRQQTYPSPGYSPDPAFAQQANMTTYSSPMMAPQRIRTNTADAVSFQNLRHDRRDSENSDKYWENPPPPPPLNGVGGGMYQQSNVSAPHVDGPGAMNSRGPPLADDFGFDKLSIAARSKSPTPSLGAASARVGPTGQRAAVERANAAYATQEIYQSAAEVHPDNSLRAIADEVDQTAADIKQGNLQGPPPPQQQQQQSGLDGSSMGYNDGSISAMAHATNFDPNLHAYNGVNQQQMGGYDPNVYSQGSSHGGWYGNEGGQQYYEEGQGQYSYGAAYHQPQQSPYFGNQMAGPSSQMSGYDAAGNPYMAAAQGFGLDYPGAPSNYSAYPGVEPTGRAPSISGNSMMPSLARQGTQLSMASAHSSTSNINGRRRSKDASSKAPQQTLPFNKAFVDEYRQRMKGDPDPEAQFAYSRYLIEAAKKVQDPKDGPKQARKYRDALLSESLKLVKRLATTGTGLGKPPYAEAQFFLANCFGNGSLGLQVDHEKAYNLYVQASKQNHPAATYRTAVCNEVGAGTRRDHHRAVLFYRKASALGDTAGMYKLGMILLNGLLGQPRNIREAIVWLKRAAGQADEDNPHALHELGLLYEKSTNSIVPHDEAHARELFTQAAQLGYAPSQFKLGSAYEYGTLTCPVDPRRSIAWYTKAAGKNDGESELALSGWYLTGSEGVLKQSDSEAYLWARRAATKGIPKAEYAVGYYSEVGIGVESNIEEAKRWYMRAAAQGNKRAMMRLTELKQQKDGRGGKKGARPTRKDAESECVVM